MWTALTVLIIALSTITPHAAAFPVPQASRPAGHDSAFDSTGLLGEFNYNTYPEDICKSSSVLSATCVGNQVYTTCKVNLFAHTAMPSDRYCSPEGLVVPISS